MAKGFLRVVLALISIGIGYGLTIYWQSLRPGDDSNTVLIIGVVGAIASFTCLHFLTKGSGGD
ncbi:MAG: hypothetical protein ABII22_05375 [Candidatus Micrarchaeota archaeon]